MKSPQVRMFDRWRAINRCECCKNLPVFDISDCIGGLRCIDDRAAITGVGAPMMPPYDKQFFEYAWNSDWLFANKHHKPDRVGVWATVETIKINESEESLVPHRTLKLEIMLLFGKVLKAMDTTLLTPLYIGLDRDGCVMFKAVRDIEEALEGGTPTDGGCADIPLHGCSEWTEFEKFVFSLVEPVLYSIALLNCKNISTVERHPDQKLSRAFQQRHGEPLHKYHVLTINPGLSKSYDNTEKRERHETLLPHHLVRGHFKTYSPEKPLLGRFFGRFFWSPHARGDKKNGTVEKDYRVAAPMVDGPLVDDEVTL